MSLKDAGGDAGATPGAEGDSQSPDDSAEVRAETSTGVAGDGAGLEDDDSDDDDYTDVPFNEHPRFKQLTRKLSKRTKQLAKLRPVAERVKGVDVDEMLGKARTSDQIQAVLTRFPKLRQQVIEAMASPTGEAEPEPEFDPQKLPFDVSDASGKFFADFYKEFLDIKKQNAALMQHVRGMGEATRLQNSAAESRAWKAAVVAASEHVPEPSREMFHDAVYGAFKEARERRVKVDPQRVIDHYLKGYGGNSRTQAKASAAAAQRIAENNKNLPHQPKNPGTFASAKGDRKETVADVSRRLKQAFAR